MGIYRRMREMTEKEVKAYLAEMKKFADKVSSSPKASRDFLVKAGILTPKGNLKKPYR